MLTEYQVLKKVFKLKVICTLNSSAYIGEFRNDNEFDFDFFRLLIYFNIIEQDFGNWETGEKYYILNSNYVRNENGINIIMLDKLKIEFDRILLINNHLYGYCKPDLFIKVYNRIKLEQIRKQKLKKLYDNSMCL